MTSESSSLYDVAIIGGGPAGAMAALSAKKHHPDYSVVILEKTAELGKKLTIAGAGRGNLTNVYLKDNPASMYHGDKDLLASVFQQFSYENIITFFSELGIPLYEEKKTERGKIFPLIDHAKTVRNIIVDELSRVHVVVKTMCEVKEIAHLNTFWDITTTDGTVQAKRIILTTGGKTYPAFGSDGFGYELAKKFGHTIISPVPSAVPIVSKNPLSHYLQGEKMNIAASVFIDGKMMEQTVGDVLFTNYGLSGSAILDISRAISPRINRDGKQGVAVQLSFFPTYTSEQVMDIFQERWNKYPEKLVSHSLWGLCTEKLASAVCIIASLPKDKKVSELSDAEKKFIVTILTSFDAEVTATRGWNEAEFTVGGIAGNEIDARTLASKKAKQLYFAGEILDVDGPIGGYNLSWAWASGWVSGKVQ